MSEHEVLGPFGTPVPSSQAAVELRHNELNLFDATAVAVSSVAPAYSAASTMTAVFVIAGIGYSAPSVLIYSFVPVLFIALSYFHLNRRNPNCGASYSWLSEIVHPTVGWFNGWVQIATSVLFCTTAPLLAGTYSLQFLHSAFGLVSEQAINSSHDVALVAALWLFLVTFICVYGIRWTTNAQWVMVLIEYVCVVGFSVGGIIKALIHRPVGARAFSINWINPLHIHGTSALAGGLVLGVFFYWGWDTALNLNEESKDANRIPGRAAIISMWLLLFVFLLNFVAAQMLLTPEQISNAGPNVLFFFGERFAGSWASYVMVFAVLSSTVATTQTTLLPAARITYAMARDGVFPKLFGSVHEKYQTPALGTVILSLVSLVGIMLTTFSASMNTVFNNLVNNIGILVAFYYGATGLACAWAFRKTVGKAWWPNVTMVWMPLLGGIGLLYTCYEVIVSGGSSTIPDIVIVAIGIPLTIWAKVATRRSSPFFHQRPVSYDTLDELDRPGTL